MEFVRIGLISCQFDQPRSGSRGAKKSFFFEDADDMVATDVLIPKRLNAKRPSSDFTIPNEETRREFLIAYIDPTIVVYEKHEQILFAAIKPSPMAIERSVWRLEFRFRQEQGSGANK